MNVLITGSTGLVGSYCTLALRGIYTVLAPPHNVLDISDTRGVTEYVKQTRPDAIVNAAGFTDADAAEKQSGDRNGECWRVNVEGARNVFEAGKDIDAYVIQISTGSVFSGTKGSRGPFSETDDPHRQVERLGWYALTKLESERFGDTIIRLSHPVCSDPDLCGSDYIHRMLRAHEEGSLYPLFDDQLFPLTYLPDLSKALQILMIRRLAGVYHVASSDMTSPYALMYAIVKNTNPDNTKNLKKSSIDEFLNTVPVGERKRYSKYSAIDSIKTQRELGIRFHTIPSILQALTL